MTRKELKQLLDYECNVRGGDILLSYHPDKHSVYLFRMSQYHASHKGLWHLFMKKYYSRKLVRLYGILASPYAQIGKGLRFVHPTGIVVGAHVRAGECLALYQHSTLGGAHLGDVHKGNQPVIGDHVTIFSGAAALGAIHIGDNVTVGANSTLLNDAPDNSICVGSPARIIIKGS